MPELTIAQSINKAYRKVSIDKKSFDVFKLQLERLYDQISAQDSEAKLKEDLMDFLKYTFYGQSYKVSPHGSIDFAIHLGESVEDPVGVLFEIKMPSNISEMITRSNINKKAMQEMLLYYLRERVGNKNIDLKNLVITDGYKFFIFDAHEFERYFFSNKRLIKDFVEFNRGGKSSRKTELFYKEIASEAIEAVKDKIQFTWFDIRKYKNSLFKEADRRLIELYKVFSPEHLLKRPFQTDSNLLNTKFYAELLYIIGLEEAEDRKGGRRIITRKKENNRCQASLIENAMAIIDEEDWLNHIDNREEYGADRSEQIFNVALELCLCWTNRILFLKLLEAQIVRYHKGDRQYAFLQSDRISNFNDLNKLFFRVLARRQEERSAEVNKLFGNVPYLNSSLFEMGELERNSIRIANLDSLDLPLYSDSVLKGSSDFHYKKLSTLKYLIEFLDAYDFSGEGNGEIMETTKTLINASVLGLIFEKINGYKYGAVFTPGAITMFMSRNAVQSVIVRRFNEEMGWNCKDYDELKNMDISDLKQANEIIDSIRICDPAVGSGHYLVSVLNEIIHTKFDLGILLDRNGRRIKRQDWIIEIDNDELMVFDSEGEPFVYQPGNLERQRIQEALFHEKQKIIENCIFGVDINKNAVNICRLRLWIELLKNSYYTVDSDYKMLQTLPNIDINIKTGNSLVYRFPLSQDISSILKNDGISIQKYKESVVKYKNARSKTEKRELEMIISGIKAKLTGSISEREPKTLEKIKFERERNALLAPELFDIPARERARKEKKAEELKLKIVKLEADINKIKTRYSGSLEWRIEFPEILDEEGRYVGFDCVIGNPPYIQLQKMGTDTDILQKMTYQSFDRTGDIYCLFYELGIKLLKTEGMLSYLTSNKWMRADYGRKLRGFLSLYCDTAALIDFADNKIFDKSVSVNILTAVKQENKGKTFCCSIEERIDLNKLSEYVNKNSAFSTFHTDDPWVALSDVEKTVRDKIKSAGAPLNNHKEFRMYYGIKTGFNEAFIITTDKRNEILSQCTDEDERRRTEQLIKPILQGRDIHRYTYDDSCMWIVNIHNGIKDRIERIHIEDYPSVKAYLDKFLEILSNRNDKGDTPYNLRNCAYLEDFSMPKITWGNLNKKGSYALVPKNVFISAPACMIVPGSSGLLAILNSKVADYYVKSLGVARSGGYIEYKPMFVGQIPIPAITEEFTAKINSVLSSDLSNEEKDALIDDLVGDLYGLSLSEKEFINEI